MNSILYFTHRENNTGHNDYEYCQSFIPGIFFQRLEPAPEKLVCFYTFVCLYTHLFSMFFLSKTAIIL